MLIQPKDIKHYKADTKKWKLASEGPDADVDPRLLERAEAISKKSRVTYLEANLLRHLRKQSPGQLESTAVWEYVVKYREVDKDSVLPFIVERSVALWKKSAPVRKTDAGLEKVPPIDFPW